MYTPYERMKERAFEILRDNKVKDFSDLELHRAFKHCKEKLLYTSIVRTAIEDGLTINNLYEDDRSNGFER